MSTFSNENHVTRGFTSDAINEVAIRLFTLSILKNNICYELLLNEKFKKPIGFNTWNTYLQQELPKCETVCYFIFNYLIKRKQVEGLQMEIITFLYSYQKNYL